MGSNNAFTASVYLLPFYADQQRKRYAALESRKSLLFSSFQRWLGLSAMLGIS